MLVVFGGNIDDVSYAYSLRLLYKLDLNDCTVFIYLGCTCTVVKSWCDV